MKQCMHCSRYRCSGCSACIGIGNESLPLAIMLMASGSDSRGKGSRIVSIVAVATLTWGRREKYRNKHRGKVSSVERDSMRVGVQVIGITVLSMMAD